MHRNCRLLPDHIVCKITQRCNMRRVNTCDPTLKLLNEKITSDIYKSKQTFESNIYMHTKITDTIHRFVGRPCTVYPTEYLHSHFHNIKQQNNNQNQKYCNYFTQLFTNTVRHATYKQTYALSEQH